MAVFCYFNTFYMKTHRPLLIPLLFGAWLWAAGDAASFQRDAPFSVEAARERVNTIAREFPERPVQEGLRNEWCNAQLYLRKTRFLLDACLPSEALLAFVTNECQNAESVLAGLRRGVQPDFIAGLREEGYYSDNDGSFQPFRRYLPKRAKPGEKLPLLVFLHGYNPAFNIVNWPGIPEHLMAFAERAGFAVAAPFGRGNTDYQGIGEQDVLTVIDEMRRRYAIDENRVILAGHSMGASGVWTIGAHYPDRFAGLFAVSGRGDYYTWKKVDRESVPAYKRRLIDAEFAAPFAGNLRAIPIFCAHGAQDDILPVEEGRFIAAAVKRANPGLLYFEVEDGHDIWERVFEGRAAQRFLRQCRRAPLPEGYRAPHPRYARGSDVNGARRVCGPVKEAFLTPFIFLLAGDPVRADHAPRFDRAVADWQYFAQAPPRTVRESAVTPEQLRSFNVFLFGEPENSALIRRVLETSPVTVTDAGYRVGDALYPRNGNGLYLVRPSPWNPEKLAVVQCGIEWGSALPANHKYDFLPDFIVYTSACDVDGSNTALAAGFFNARWQIESEGM